eukprot:scaffold81202_cov63-Phaeocystis_antarctica.AAC.1
MYRSVRASVSCVTCSATAGSQSFAWPRLTETTRPLSGICSCGRHHLGRHAEHRVARSHQLLTAPQHVRQARVTLPRHPHIIHESPLPRVILHRAVDAVDAEYGADRDARVGVVDPVERIDDDRQPRAAPRTLRTIRRPARHLNKALVADARLAQGFDEEVTYRAVEPAHVAGGLHPVRIHRCVQAARHSQAVPQPAADLLEASGEGEKHQPQLRALRLQVLRQGHVAPGRRRLGRRVRWLRRLRRRALLGLGLAREGAVGHRRRGVEREADGGHLAHVAAVNDGKLEIERVGVGGVGWMVVARRCRSGAVGVNPADRAGAD